MIRRIRKALLMSAIAGSAVAAALPATASAQVSCYWGTVSGPPCNSFTQMTPFLTVRKGNYVINRYNSFGESQQSDNFNVGFKRPSSQSYVNFYGWARGYTNPFPGSTSDPFFQELNGGQPFTVAYYDF